MIIFKIRNKYYVFIHIPKNGGKYIRQKIINDKDNNIIKKYWNIKSNFDLAHIPYMKTNNFIQNYDIDRYFANSRNPYHRIISAFFYKNRKKNIDDFKHFVKNILTCYDFDMSFNSNIIHYYPQYLFVCDENLDIPKNIKINKLEDVGTPKKYNLEIYFDEECINIINNIYDKDFLFFNYSKIC
jgi:hypothetical protein